MTSFDGAPEPHRFFARTLVKYVPPATRDAVYDVAEWVVR